MREEKIWAPAGWCCLLAAASSHTNEIHTLVLLHKNKKRTNKVNQDSQSRTFDSVGADVDVDAGDYAYALSPRMRRASWMSLGMMVTRLAWMAQRLVSSNRPTWSKNIKPMETN